MNRLMSKLDQWTGHIKVRPKLLITFYVTSFVPILLVSLLFYMVSTQTLKEELGQYMVETARQVDLRLHAFLEEIEHLSKSLSMNQDVQRFLNLEDQKIKSAIPYQFELRDLFGTMVDYRDHLWSVFLINDYGNILYYSDPVTNPTFASWWYSVELEYDFLSDPLYQQIKQNKDFRLYPPRSAKYANDKEVVTFGGRLFQLSKEKGTLLFHFDPEYFSAMSDSVQIGKTGYVAILSETGQLLFSRESLSNELVDGLLDLQILERDSGYDSLNIEGVQTLVAFHTSPKTGWKIVSVVPFHEVSGTIANVRNSIYIIAGAAVLLVILFSRYLSQVITSPLFQLREYMRKAETGNFSLRVPLHRSDEFGMLTKTFNRMLERLESYKERVFLSEMREMKLQLLNRESELMALQMQINPHFLYNTLNTMRCIGEVYEVKEVAEMSESLGDMFKYSIEHNRYKRLEEEIRHVKSYLSIIQIRYQGLVHCHYDIPEQLNELPVLKLIVQPLVENAVEHGIIPMGGAGNIEIKARMDKDSVLVIQVHDDGIGIPEPKLLEIQDTLRSLDDSFTSEAWSAGHIGLYNVQQRLRLNYGRKGRLTIQSKPHQGTTVQICIPIEDQPGGEA